MEELINLKPLPSSLSFFNPQHHHSLFPSLNSNHSLFLSQNSNLCKILSNSTKLSTSIEPDFVYSFFLDFPTELPSHFQVLGKVTLWYLEKRFLDLGEGMGLVVLGHVRETNGPEAIEAQNQFL